MLRGLILKIRRRETPAADFAYRSLKAVMGLSFPVIRPLHSALYTERRFRREIWSKLTKGLYYEPMFRSQCVSVGSGFQLVEGGGDGVPLIIGDLQITVGNDVTIMDKIVLVAPKYFDKPELIIGDNTFVGPNLFLSAGKRVRIGKHCLISAHMITDNSNHPTLDAVKRVKNEPLSPSDARPIEIGDYAWVATGASILPGCKIGDGAVVLPYSQVVGMEVPPFTLAGGNPARILAKMPLTKSLREFVGEERFQTYVEAHKALKIRRSAASGDN